MVRGGWGKQVLVTVNRRNTSDGTEALPSTHDGKEDVPSRGPDPQSVGQSTHNPRGRTVWGMC